ncbi:hem-containing dehydratase protein [Elsinoe ampelina]|uniref:Hem-containing dehydratase protein n=1 Tax=Elsinoe ampelina TaxID=302913 RepID=A0A6A6G9V0_9PEZI|nr:hem-containing dehydratase protein [Elsinoe ampelina]
MACPVRRYPLKQPPNHEPPIPRYMMKFPDDLKQICTAYLGAQSHREGQSPDQARTAIQKWLKGLASDQAPYHYEHFIVEKGQDIPGCHVWVLYRSDKDTCERTISTLDLPALYSTLNDKSTGLWCERFTTPMPRLETNYSNDDYFPGLAKLASAEPKRHTLSAYWGAARDRIPESANDRFSKEDDQEELRRPPHLGSVKGLGQHIKGSNPYDNLCHIRSGQFWEKCEAVELEAYETKLRSTLLNGLGYLWDNPLDNGVIGLRFLRNVEKDGDGKEAVPRKESCGAGFFRNLADLEHWAEKHMSHLKIWTGAISHAKRFGPEMGLRLFHEVSVLKKGEAEFEYVNCLPETGAIRYMKLEHVVPL